MVLAVYMPEQLPQPGQAASSSWASSSSVILPLAVLPTASKVELKSTILDAFCRSQFPSQHRPAADKNRGQIQSERRHQHAGNYFIAIRDKDQGIEGMSLGH